jgi:adenylate kinase family enzyme
MKRILVIGSSGAGKSVFSRRLSRSTGIPVIHLDTIHWKPNWVESEHADFDARLNEILKQDEWIIDGNYGRTLEMRLLRADAVVLLDMNRVLCTFRVLRRALAYRNGGRSDMAAGCPEKVDWEFLKWTWQYPTRSRGSVLKKLRNRPDGTKVFRLSSRMQVQRFFQELERAGSLDRLEPQIWK